MGGGERVRVFGSETSLSRASFVSWEESPDGVIVVGSTASPLAEGLVLDNVVMIVDEA